MEKIGDLIFHCEKANKLTKKVQNRWVLVPRSHLVFSNLCTIEVAGITFLRVIAQKMRKGFRFRGLLNVVSEFGFGHPKCHIWYPKNGSF